MPGEEEAVEPSGSALPFALEPAREAGCATATGVDMFVRQAALQFEIFTDREAPIEMMRSEFKRTIGAARQ